MDSYDIAVIGGGPAGAHAAAKAALLFRTCVLLDKGRKFSRIFWSPKVANLPGRHGESGRDIIAGGYAMLESIEADLDRSFVTVHENTEVTGAERDEDGWFVLTAEGKEGVVQARAKNLVLATGCVDAQPKLRDFRRRDIEAVLPYANKGLADYCLLCDGHTVEGKKVAVIGCDPGSRGIAKSLKKNFGARTAVVPYCNPSDGPKSDDAGGPRDPQAAWESVEADLGKWEIPIHYGGIKEFTGIKDGRFGIVFEDESTEWFDKAWVSMGWFQVNNQHAQMLGAALDGDGFVKTDRDCRVLGPDGDPIKGLYCIGDLRAETWKQIPVAWGEAETAVVDAFVS